MHTNKSTDPPDGKTWWFLSDCRDNDIKRISARIHHIITEISICTLVLGAASQYLDGFFESNSRNCGVILEVIAASSDGLCNLG